MRQIGLSLISAALLAVGVSTPVVADPCEDGSPHCPAPVVMQFSGSGRTRLNATIKIEPNDYRVLIYFTNTRTACHIRRLRIDDYEWPGGRRVNTFAGDTTALKFADTFHLTLRTGCDWTLTISEWQGTPL